MRAGCLFASYSYEAQLFDEGTHRLIANSIEHFRRVFGDKLQEAIIAHPPVLPDVDPYELADLASAAFQGAYVLWRVTNASERIALPIEHFRKYIELLFGVRGARARESRVSGRLHRIQGLPAARHPRGAHRAVDRGDDVALLQAGRRGWGARADADDHNTLLQRGAQAAGDHRAERDLLDAQVRVNRVPGRHELIGDRLGAGDRDREANPLRLHARLGLPCH